MPDRARNHPSYARLVVGLAIVALGLAFTLDNLGLLDVDFHRLFRVYWPVVFIALGLANLIQSRSWTGCCGGLIWLFIGGWLIAEHLGLVTVEIWAFWPLVLVFIGGHILLGGGRLRDRLLERGTGAGVVTAGGVASVGGARAKAGAGAGAPPAAGGIDSADRTVNVLAVMSGVARRIGSRDFLGGDLVAIMGGCKIDLREAEIASSPARLDVFTLWGGIEVIVPERWGVDMHVLPFMGGADDHTVQPPAGAPRLLVRGMVVMGGIDIRNTPQ